MYTQSRKTARKSLEDERVRIYSRLKSAKTPQERDALIELRDKVSAEIKVIRHELFLVGDIERRTEEIRQKLRAQREYARQQLSPEKSQQARHSRGAR